MRAKARKPARKRPTTTAAREAERKTPAPVTCNERELAFIDRWLRHFNGSRAVIEARITSKPKVAKGYASLYLNRPHVLLEIAARRSRSSKHLEDARERVMAELLAVSLSKLSDVAEWDGDELELIHPGDLTEDQLAAIAEIEISPGKFGTRKLIKLHSKISAGVEFLKALGPSEAELSARTKGGAGSGAGVTIQIYGGPTGLELSVSPKGEEP